MTTIWDNLEKSTMLAGWTFNEALISFNQLLDPDTGNTVYFNGLGLDQTWTNQIKI